MVEWIIDTFSILCIVIVAFLVCLGAFALVVGVPYGVYFLWGFACGAFAICFFDVWRA